MQTLAAAALIVCSLCDIVVGRRKGECGMEACRDPIVCVALELEERAPRAEHIAFIHANAVFELTSYTLCIHRYSGLNIGVALCRVHGFPSCIRCNSPFV